MIQELSENLCMCGKHMPYYAKKLQEEGFPKGIYYGRSINIKNPQETVIEDIKHMDGETKKLMI